MKVVSGCDDESLEEIAKVYSIVCQAGIHKAPSIKVAEAAKIIENTFRQVNIALVNELAILARGLGVDIWESLRAAATKPFGYMPFWPGPGVGGHCISIDPTYLSWRAGQQGRESRAPCGMSGRRLAADAVGHRCRAGQESSEASAVIAATSSWVSWMRATARFSLKCCTLVVPGIGSALGVR